MISNKDIENMLIRSGRILTKRVYCYFLAHPEFLEDEYYLEVYEFNFDKLLRDLKKEKYPVTQFLADCKNSYKNDPTYFETFKSDFEKYVENFKKYKRD